MPTEPAASSDPASDRYFFSDLAIVPPLEEFRRLFEKKARSFESGDADSGGAPYERAFRLGEEKILRHLGIEAADPPPAGDAPPITPGPDSTPPEGGEPC